MIGIYKITNKLNGKSYIGQSIHCGERFDQHCGNINQLIDQTIQKEGIENFTFEILKVLENQNELNYWEDYYIIQYNTIFPNGYNKRWNISYKDRCLIEKEKILRENKEENIEIFDYKDDLQKESSKQQYSSNGYHQLKEIPDISFSKSRYTKLQKERLRGIQNVIKEYNKLKLNKYDDTEYFIEEISDKTLLRWRVFKGTLEIKNAGVSKEEGISFRLLDLGTLVKKLKENHEENIINQFYIRVKGNKLMPVIELSIDEIKELLGNINGTLYIE